jgi:hypothetical protein
VTSTPRSPSDESPRYVDADYLRSVIDGHLEPHGAEDPVYRSGKVYAFRLVKAMLDEVPGSEAGAVSRKGKPHVPVVRLVTPEPDSTGATRAIFTRLTIDGQEWAVIDYAIKGHVDGIQHVTLTFLADVTVGHPEPSR